MRLEVGMSAALDRTVTESDTAAVVGSGSLPVLGTPVLLAWCEAATCAALEPGLEDGETSVGTRVSLDHQAPSVVGATLDVTASVVHVDGRLARLSVAARQDSRLVASGEVTRVVDLVASGEVTRVVVGTERFLARLS